MLGSNHQGSCSTLVSIRVWLWADGPTPKSTGDLRESRQREVHVCLVCLALLPRCCWPAWPVAPTTELRCAALRSHSSSWNP